MPSLPEATRAADDATSATTSAAVSWRDRLLLAAPTLSLLLVLLLLWGFVAWFTWVYPKGLLDAQRRDLFTSSRAAAALSAAVLHRAQSSLRTVDLWMATRLPRDGSQDPAALRRLGETVQDNTLQLVSVALLTRQGQILPINAEDTTQSAAPANRPTLDDPALFNELRKPMREGLIVGVPLPAVTGGPVQLPLAMRPSVPRDDLLGLVALVDMQRFSTLLKDFAIGPSGTVLVMRKDGRVLAHSPELVGHAGRNVFAGNRLRREDFAQPTGEVDSQDADGTRRSGAYQTLPRFGVQVLVTAAEDDALVAYREQRDFLIALSALVSLGALAAAMLLTRATLSTRLRDAQQRAAADASPIGLFRCDRAGRVTYANDTFQRLLGLDAAQLEWGWLSLIPPAERDTARMRWAALMANTEPASLVRRMQRPDGEQRLMSLRIAPLRVQGRLIGQAGTLEDITERDTQEKAQRTLAAIFEQTPDYIFQLDAQGRILFANPSARRRLGFPADGSLLGLSYQNFCAPERVDRFYQEILPAVLREGFWNGRGSVTDPSTGTEVPTENTVLVHHGRGGEIEVVSMIMRDVSAEVMARRKGERSEAMLLAVAQTAPVMIAVLDTQQRCLFVNESLAKHHGVRREDWQGRHIKALLGEADYTACVGAIEGALVGRFTQLERRYETRKGPLVIDVQYAPLLPASGEIEGVIVISRDITETHLETARLREASQTDPLTRLLNRAGFAKGFEEQLSLTREHDGSSLLCLLYMDLDRFKPVNDKYGHPVGDALLKAVAGRLRHALRPRDLLARLGGDEFAVLLPGLRRVDDAEAVAAKLVETLGTPFRVGELTLNIGISIGFCVASGERANMERMVASADARLYEAKRGGRARFVGGRLEDEEGDTEPSAMIKATAS